MIEEKDRELILETIESMLKLQLNSVSELLGKEQVDLQPTRRKREKGKYIVDLTVKILTEEKRPMHVDELVEALRQRYGRMTERDSLASALAKKANQGILVSRVAPATFALREQD